MTGSRPIRGLAALLVAASLAACGGDGPDRDGGPRGPELDGPTIAAATRAATSAAVELTSQTELPALDAVSRLQLRGAATLVSDPGATRFAATGTVVAPQTAALDLEVRMLGRRSFARGEALGLLGASTDGWVELTGRGGLLQFGTGPTGGPGDLLAALSGLRDLDAVGTERLDGRPVTRLRADTTFGAFAEAQGRDLDRTLELPRGLAGMAVDRASLLEEIRALPLRFEVLADERARARMAEVSYDLAGPLGRVGGQRSVPDEIVVTIRMRLWDFGREVQVQAPPA